MGIQEVWESVAYHDVYFSNPISASGYSCLLPYQHLGVWEVWEGAVCRNVQMSIPISVSGHPGGVGKCSAQRCALI